MEAIIFRSTDTETWHDEIKAWIYVSKLEFEVCNLYMVNDKNLEFLQIKTLRAFNNHG